MRLYPASLLVAMALFFLCGFSTVLNDSLIPFLHARMQLSHTSSSLIQLSFYLAYFLVSPLAGWLFAQADPSRGMRWGALLAGLGALAIACGSLTEQLGALLCAVFILGSGIALIQVCCNLYVVMQLGGDSPAARLSLTQAFTNVGTVLAPSFGASLMLGRIDAPAPLLLPYMLVALTWACLLLMMRRLAAPKQTQKAQLSPWRHVLREPAVHFALLSIPLAVGVEVAVASFLVQYLHEHGLGLITAGRLSMLFWLGFVCGRLMAHRLLQRFSAFELLTVHTLAGAVMAAVAWVSRGPSGSIAALGLGLCTSVLFPLLYSVCLERVRSNRAQVSGLLCMANLGGALVPLLFGILADRSSVQASFVLPCLVYILLALLIRREKKRGAAAPHSEPTQLEATA